MKNGFLVLLLNTLFTFEMKSMPGVKKLKTDLFRTYHCFQVNDFEIPS